MNSTSKNRIENSHIFGAPGENSSWYLNPMGILLLSYADGSENANDFLSFFASLKHSDEKTTGQE